MQKRSQLVPDICLVSSLVQVLSNLIVVRGIRCYLELTRIMQLVNEGVHTKLGSTSGLSNFFATN